MKLQTIKKRLKQLANREKAEVLQRFFKTGPGEYGEGDVFIGARVPDLRKLAKEFQDMGFEDIKSLLGSIIHEERLLALLILVLKYSKGNENTKT